MATSRSYESSFVLLDFRESHQVPPTSLLLAPMRRRIYAVLFKDCPKVKSAVTITEWCFAGNGSLDEPSLQEIDLTSGLSSHSLVSLREVNDLSESTKAARLELFSFIISPTINVNRLRDFPTEHLFVACQLYYLQNECENGPILHSWEVEAFILQKLLLQKKSLTELSAIRFPPNVPDYRGVQLATLFCRSLIVMAAQLVGMKDVLQHLLLVRNFDGKLFQSIYLEIKHGRSSIEQIAKREGVDEVMLKLIWDFATCTGSKVR